MIFQIMAFPVLPLPASLRNKLDNVYDDRENVQKAMNFYRTPYVKHSVDKEHENSPLLLSKILLPSEFMLNRSMCCHLV